MSGGPPTSEPGDAEVPIEDVWSRTDPKYRRRAIVLLTINVCLFAGLGCVAYWLRTGVVLAPAADGYLEQLRETFDPTLQTAYTPIGLSLGPVSVERVPMMIPVLGLILAALVSIPILVTNLYRLPSALPFIAVVGFIAVMPWLAIALLASCLLISVNPLKFRSRFASALLALIPVILYFFLASRQESSAVALVADPADRVKLMAPLILAVIASGIVMGIVLIIARIVNYRPGAIAPLLAILFLAPAAMFEFEVGRDELHYRLLESSFGPGSEYFVRERIDSVFEAAVERAFKAQMDDQSSYEAVRSAMELKWLFALDADANLLFTSYQDRAARAADRFVQRFPDSVYAINALYIQGRALDMRVDMEEFRQRHEIAFYGEFPSGRSRTAWEKIEHNAPTSPAAAEALLRLAILDIRAGQVDKAAGRLERLETVFGGSSSSLGDPAPETPMDTLMQREPPESTLNIVMEQVVLKGRKLLDLLRNNRDPLWRDDPLVALMHLDPQHARYAANLASLLERYPRCQLEDNIELLIATAEPDVNRRVEALVACYARFPGGDAACPTSYEIGVAYQALRRPTEARSAFERVVADCPDSPWRQQADSRLRRLERSSTPEGA